MEPKELPGRQATRRNPRCPAPVSVNSGQCRRTAHRSLHMVPGEVLEFGKSQDPWECPFPSRCPERRRERDLPNPPVSKALPHHRDLDGLRCFHFGAGGLSGSTGIQYSGQSKLRHHWRTRQQTQVLRQAIAHSSGANCRQEPNVCGSCLHCGHKLTGAPRSAWQVSPQVCGCLFSPRNPRPENK